MTEVVRRREPNLPYGFVVREVRTVPRVAVTVSPMTAVIACRLQRARSTT